MKKILSTKIGSVLFYGLLGLALYFGNIELQSYWGRQALAQTGLVSVPLADALVRAKAENKLVLLDISAIWCSSCRKLDNTVFSDGKVKKAINDRFIFTRLEYESDEGQRFLEKNDVSGFPTVWILDSSGGVVKQVNISFDPVVFLGELHE